MGRNKFENNNSPDLSMRYWSLPQRSPCFALPLAHWPPNGPEWIKAVFLPSSLSLKTGSYGSSSGWQVGGNLCWHCVLRLGAIYLWTQFSQNLSRRSPILQRTERANGPIHPLALGAQMSSGHGSRTLANFGKEKEYLGLTGCSQSESLQWNCSLSPRVCIVVSL